MKTIILVTLFFSVATTFEAEAGSVAGFGGSTEFTQIFNNLELIGLNASELKTLEANFRQYQLMVRNIQRLPDHLKRDVRSDLVQLAKAVTTGRSISFQNSKVHKRFEKVFPGYQQRSQKKYPNFEAEYREWSQTNHDTVRGALTSAGLQADQFYDEDAAIRVIDRQLQSAEGQVQAIQAAGRIASAQVEQMQKLRQLVASQTELQAIALANTTNAADKERVNTDRYRLKPFKTRQ